MENYIVIADRNRKHYLLTADILHIEAVRIYSVFYMRDNTQLVASQNIGVMIKALDPEMFMRVHKSHIVNLHEIKIYQRHENARSGKLIMSNGKQIDIAQRRKRELLEHLWRVNKKVRVEKMQIKNDPRATVRLNASKKLPNLF